MNNCVCVDLFSKLQEQIAELISAYISTQTGNNLPSTDSGVLPNSEVPLGDSNMGNGRVTLDSFFYMFMLVIGVYMLMTMRNGRGREGKKSTIAP